MGRLSGALAPAILQVAAAATASIPPFEAFVELHARTYRRGSAEYAERRGLYERRAAEAERHNSNPDRLWTAGVNSLWDNTEAEMAKLRGWVDGARPAHSASRIAKAHPAFLQHRARALELPEEKSWAHLAAMQHISTQGGCGSCWAISAATVLQAHTEIHTGKKRSFSAQQIVSCTPNPNECGGKGRCDGATLELAMEWVLKHGCADESQVPYTGEDGECAAASGSPVAMMSQLTDGDSSAGLFGSGGSAFGMTGWEMLPRNSAEPLMRALVERGPVGVSVAGDDWFSYASGVFDGCGKDAVIDHAVVLIGYGQDAGQKYWHIQNSWGPDWGEAGHIRLLRNEDYCGTDNKPELGTGCKGETDPVPVCGMCGVLYDSVVPHFD